MTNYDAILWDIDQTLLDFSYSESITLKYCFKAMGFGECTDQMVERYSVINIKWWEALERGEMTKPQILVGRYEEFLKELNLDYSRASELNSMYQNHLGENVRFMPFGKEIIEFFNGKIAQGVVSNGTVIAQTKKLKNSGITRLITNIFLSEQVGFEKPAKQFFDFVFKTMNLKDSSRVLVVGDSLTSDVQGAINAGAKSCWYNPNHKENNKGIIPDFEISSLEEVIGLVFQNMR